MIRISKLNNINLERIKEIISNSGIIIFPTETVWGIGCKYNDKKAIKRLYEIKGRDFSNPLQIQISYFDELEKFTAEPKASKFRKISEQILPGPFTIVVKKKGIPDFVTSGLDTAGIRYSSCKQLTDMINYFGYPLASTSCNKSGEPVLTEMNDIERFAEEYADILLDIDCKTKNISSTIVSFENNELKLLRDGAIKFENIISRIAND